MSQDLAPLSLPPRDHAALHAAVKALESPNLAARIADYAGVPVNRVLSLLPKAANRQLSGMVRSAVMRGLEVAVDTLNDKPPPAPAVGFSSFLAGVTGGVSGLFGFGALAVELPLTTTLMLRAIAEIAQHEGEDLSRIEARLACLEVFAYGTKRANENVDVGYYAARALISKYTNDAAAYILERGAVDASAPVISNLVSEIVSRFGLVVSDKVAAGAVPIIGAVCGATVNVIFMDHFQKIAKGHFTLRRLERLHGSASVRQHYADIASRLGTTRTATAKVAVR
ncbi:EcsC family protein [Bradyrhizobium genosp. L]|uniref:EcsC family protein n=1 Tax=Bradyrhizobium genosp. L TaxID=83637 RepID=UPI0018A329F7|nr:EcsC family protein [Bradyrhizobium genosp. L]QPF84520.1 EcsC family protein [Bradyrhizobium genosp. L]